jgi:hypothetical protein
MIIELVIGSQTCDEEVTCWHGHSKLQAIVRKKLHWNLKRGLEVDIKWLLLVNGLRAAQGNICQALGTNKCNCTLLRVQQP